MSEMTENGSAVLSCQGLKKIYRQGTGEGAEVPVLTGVDLEMTPIAWAGVALVALAVGLILFGRKNSRKSKRK